MRNDLFITSIKIAEEKLSDQYLEEIAAIRQLQKRKLVFDNPLTFFVGENGSGKSTLLEAIAIASGFNPEGGSRNFRFSSHDSTSSLYKQLEIARHAHFRDGFFLRAESFYNLASNIDDLDKGGGGRPLIDSYGGVSLHEQSHGESFLSLMANRFSENGLYLLDEPEAALSARRAMQLLVLIHDLLEEGCQFIIATHSPILMSYPAACIYDFSDAGIKRIAYEESDSFRVYRDFIERPKQIYHYLFEEEG